MRVKIPIPLLAFDVSFHRKEYSSCKEELNYGLESDLMLFSGLVYNNT